MGEGSEAVSRFKGHTRFFREPKHDPFKEMRHPGLSVVRPTVACVLVAEISRQFSLNALWRSDRYNVTFMIGLVYAAVAYVRSPAGIFVEELRRELHSAHTHADAHLTVLPPRPLRGTEQQALRVLTEVSQSVRSFEVTMGDVESFVPVTPTIFLRVARGAYRMRELHDLLNRDALEYEEPWPYMPHLTVVKADTVEEAKKVEVVARQRWSAYTDSRTVRIDSLTFVKGNGERWVDLATLPLIGVPVR